MRRIHKIFALGLIGAAILPASVWILRAPPNPQRDSTAPTRPPEPAPTESADDQLDLSNLRALARAWISRERDYDAQGRSARKPRDQARHAFVEEATKTFGSLQEFLWDIESLLAIFDCVFPYSPVEGTGAIVKREGAVSYPKEGVVHYWESTPKDYNPSQKYPATLVLTEFDTNTQADFQNRRTAHEYLTNSVTVVPKLQQAARFDDITDLADAEAEVQEQFLLAKALFPLGEAQRRYRLDRRRIIIDCDVTTSAFGLRLATYFPDRFAGIILRNPKAPESLRLANLRDTFVLLISTAETHVACRSLARRLSEAKVDAVAIIAANSKDSSRAIDAWTTRVIRPLFPDTVVIAPNCRRYRRSHWVQIDKCVPEGLPRLQAEVDRSTNSIVIHASNVGSVHFKLNDALLDLDRPVTFVVNQRKITTVELRRTLRILTLGMNFDSTRLYPATFDLEIPQ